MKLEGKNAVVTGAGSGIGRAIAERLGEEGATVTIAEINATSGTDAVRCLEKRGIRATFIRTDVSQPAELESLVVQVAKLSGTLIFFINTVGLNFLRPLVETLGEVGNQL